MSMTLPLGKYAHDGISALHDWEVMRGLVLDLCPFPGCLFVDTDLDKSIKRKFISAY